MRWQRWLLQYAGHLFNCDVFFCNMRGRRQHDACGNGCFNMRGRPLFGLIIVRHQNLNNNVDAMAMLSVDNGQTQQLSTVTIKTLGNSMLDIGALGSVYKL